MTQRVFRRGRVSRGGANDAMGDVLAAFAALGNADRAKEVVAELQKEQSALTEAAENMREEAERLDAVRLEVNTKLEEVNKALVKVAERDEEVKAKEASLRESVIKLSTQKAKLEEEKLTD